MDNWQQVYCVENYLADNESEARPVASGVYRIVWGRDHPMRGKVSYWLVDDCKCAFWHSGSTTGANYSRNHPNGHHHIVLDETVRNGGTWEIVEPYSTVALPYLCAECHERMWDEHYLCPTCRLT